MNSFRRHQTNEEGNVTTAAATEVDLAAVDLADPAELLALYEPLGVEAVVTGPGADDPGLQQLRERRGQS